MNQIVEPKISKPSDAFVDSWLVDRLRLRDDPDILHQVCGDCDGDGSLKCCECGQDRDCPACDGVGEIDMAEWRPTENGYEEIAEKWKKLAAREYWKRYEEERKQLEEAWK